MELAAYLRRVRYGGVPHPDRETLFALHRAHLAHIPYENFDIQFQRESSLEVGPAFDKIVTRRRGGWCYEMNGLFAWALEKIGFSVTRVSGGVMREELGEATMGGHLVLLAHLDETYLCDVGFGDGMVEPAPLRDGAFTQNGFAFRLEKLNPVYWRFHNQTLGGAPSFDFTESPADLRRLAARCHYLQTDARSPFVANAIVQRVFDGRVSALRNVTLCHIEGGARQETRIDSADAYVATLRDVFDLDLPETERLYPILAQRPR